MSGLFSRLSPSFWASHSGETGLGSACVISLTRRGQNLAFNTKINMASLSFKGQATKHTTVNWSIIQPLTTSQKRWKERGLLHGFEPLENREKFVGDCIPTVKLRRARERLKTWPIRIEYFSKTLDFYLIFKKLLIIYELNSLPEHRQNVTFMSFISQKDTPHDIKFSLYKEYW